MHTQVSSWVTCGFASMQILIQSIWAEVLSVYISPGDADMTGQSGKALDTQQEGTSSQMYSRRDLDTSAGSLTVVWREV